MALAAGVRLGRRLSWPRLVRAHWTPAQRSRSRREAAEAEADAPVFQYVGDRAARVDRIFVWGFSFSGALGVPTFVLPGSGPKTRAGRRSYRRIQPVPYRLELDQKISSAACGYGFTLLSSKTKDVTKVWGMGLNKDSQLGFHRSRKDTTRGYEYVLEPSPIPLPLDRPQETQVLQVSCGRAHSLVLTDSEGGERAPVPTLLRSGQGAAGCMWRYRLCCAQRGRTCFCLGIWNSWERTKPSGNCSSRNDSTHPLWLDGVQPRSPGFPHSMWTQPLCSTYQQRRAVCVGQEHPRVPGNRSPGRPVFPVEGDDARGACGCGVWCGSHGDSGQVIHLNLPPDLLESGPGPRAARPAQQMRHAAGQWGSWGVAEEDQDPLWNVAFSPKSLVGTRWEQLGRGPFSSRGRDLQNPAQDAAFSGPSS
ncbi:RCC1-like G exchanging factor-like protein isoform X2 [Microcebus murinus]|uniref:RCC1-like G exchanging factor-like protein isoform X2 n=1 Tax=Microcebus murinus TaxID=30608 RepID=UPI003F6C36FD